MRGCARDVARAVAREPPITVTWVDYMSDDVLATIHGSDSDGSAGFEELEGLSDDETEGGDYPEWDEEAYETQRSTQSFDSHSLYVLLK